MTELYNDPSKRTRVFEQLRYNELDNLAARIFDDGRISEPELGVAKRLESDILAEFLVMGSVVKEMEKTKDPRLSAAQAMLRHLHRCFVKIDYIESKARAERGRTEYKESLDRERYKERLRDQEIEDKVIFGFLLGRSGKPVNREITDMFTDSDIRMKARLDGLQKEEEKIPDTERRSLKDLAMQTLSWLMSKGKENISSQLQNMAVSYKQRGQRVS